MDNGSADHLTAPETFSSTITFAQWLKANIPLLVAMFLISAVLFGLILANIGVPGGFILGVLLAVPFCALLVLRNKKQFDKRWSHQTVTFSPTSVVMSDPDTFVELPWTHVDAIGEVQLMPMIRPTGKSATLTTVEALQGTREHGLLGAGRLTTTPGVHDLRQRQVSQFLAGGAPDPRIGQRPMGIPLTRFERNWQQGRIGEWVRAYRPDLLS